MKGSNRTLVIALLSSGLLLAGSSATMAQQATSPTAAAPTTLYQTSKVTVVQDGDWIRWQFAEALAPNAPHVIYRGTRATDGTCGFMGTGSRPMRTQDNVFIERTVALNSNACLLETESATVARADATKRGLMAEDAKRPGVSHAEVGKEAGAALQLESGYTYTGSIQTQVEDPVNLDVADVRTNFEWNANASCVTAWHRWPDWYWFGPSGWGLDSSSWPGTDPNGNWCSGATQTTTGHFTNGIFCFFFDTWVNHAATRFNALPGGGATWSWNTTWGGGCSDLLSFNVVAN
jgi:hypothetical protein